MLIPSSLMIRSELGFQSRPHSLASVSDPVTETTLPFSGPSLWSRAYALDLANPTKVCFIPCKHPYLHLSSERVLGDMARHDLRQNKERSQLGCNTVGFFPQHFLSHSVLTPKAIGCVRHGFSHCITGWRCLEPLLDKFLENSSSSVTS